MLAGFSVNASAAVLPADCAALGGTTGEDGVCSMTGTGIGADGVNDDWTVEPGTTVVLTGGDTTDSFAVNAAAADNGSFSLRASDGASVTVEGGSASGAHAFRVGALSGGSAEFVNDRTAVFL